MSKESFSGLAPSAAQGTADAQPLVITANPGTETSVAMAASLDAGPNVDGSRPKVSRTSVAGDWNAFSRNTKSPRWLLTSALRHDFDHFVWRNEMLNPRDREVPSDIRELLWIAYEKCVDYRGLTSARLLAERNDIAELANSGQLKPINRVIDAAKGAKLRKLLESAFSDREDSEARFKSATRLSTSTWQGLPKYDVTIHHHGEFYGANYSELPRADALFEAEALARRCAIESLVGLFQLANAVTQAEAEAIVNYVTYAPLQKGA